MSAEVNVAIAKATYERLSRELDEAERRHAEAEAAMVDFEKNCPVFVGGCEFCDNTIWSGDTYNFNEEHVMYECFECISTYREMLDEVKEFWAKNPEHADDDSLTI